MVGGLAEKTKEAKQRGRRKGLGKGVRPVWPAGKFDVDQVKKKRVAMTSEEQQEGAGAASTNAPLVFQCSTCSQIVADSFAWVCSHRQLNSFTVAGTSTAFFSFS